MKQTLTLLTLGLFANLAQAAEFSEKIFCVDAQRRYVVQEFKPTEGHLGSMKFIDMHERDVKDLFCGVSQNSHRVQVACSSGGHFGEEQGTHVRLRIHHQVDYSLPQLAVIEIQKAREKPGTINEVIPMSCQQF